MVERQIIMIVPYVDIDIMEQTQELVHNHIIMTPMHLEIMLLQAKQHVHKMGLKYEHVQDVEQRTQQ